MTEHVNVLITVDIVIPRLSPSGSGWEVMLIQRGRPPHLGMWSLPGGHVSIDDTSLEAATQREAYEETGIHVPLHLLQPVQWYQDFNDVRGKYVCLLYTLKEPLHPEAQVKAGDDAIQAQWYSIEDLQSLPPLAFNHIKMLQAALHQFFVPYYHQALGMQAAEAVQCEIEHEPGICCSRSAYWRYNGRAVCVQDMPSIVTRPEKR